MQIETISKEIRIGNKSFLYENCNEYQRVIYIKLDTQLRKVKEMKNKEAKELQRAIGVLEFLTERLEAYEGLQYIEHLYA